MTAQTQTRTQTLTRTLTLTLLFAVSTAAWAQERTFSAYGYLRVRSDLFDDLDLNVGPTPSGATYFPLSASNPRDKILTAADMRLRLEPRLDLGMRVRIRGRVDVLDNVALGSNPDLVDQPAFSGGSAGQVPPPDSIRIKRAWGEVTLPIGVLAAGRMGALVSWGTGMFVNNGDCVDCDFGDAGDRIFFQTAMLGHLWMVAYDLAAVGPGVERFGQVIDLDRADDVRTVAFGVARWDDRSGIERQLRGGRTVVNYGLLASYRWQNKDAPGWYRSPQVGPFDQNAYVPRDLSVGAFDFWALVQSDGWRAEVEAASILGKTGNISLLPGAEFRQAVTQTQLGAVAKLDRGFSRFLTGVELGYASGDKAPGFGVNVNSIPRRGDLDGAQVNPPAGDNTVDNFLFARDYRIDLILWRRIIGRVTDALYVRPKLEWRAARSLTMEADVVYSRAMFAESTPSGTSTDLGLELDLRASWQVDQNFIAQLAWGGLLPGDGLAEMGRSPSAAQTLHLLLAYTF
jgi:uncharacterized protein (TIGR04551 family)